MSYPFPLVCAVTLTRDRPAMARRAIAAFRTQTYWRKRLFILDSGGPDTPYGETDAATVLVYPDLKGATIGRLRNAANRCAVDHSGADIIVHWDDDDVSHPQRIAEQVELLKASGKACVGYREVLFWDTRSRNESWLYANPDARYVVGASMCYWRSAWEACPFDDAPHEDQRWWLANAAKCVGVSAFRSSMPADLREEYFIEVVANPSFAPRLICQIHGGNSEAYDRTIMEAGGGGTWQRAPHFDAYCAERMKL